MGRRRRIPKALDNLVQLPPIPWRTNYVTASFRDAFFFVETGSKEGGRRIALHEFPKKELPYAEDMGRHAFRFSIRAYCATYPLDVVGPGLPNVFQTDYRNPRDLLQLRLDQGIPGTLRFLPTAQPIDSMPVPIIATCERYRLTEEEKFGGYCTFDIMFVEFGSPPNRPIPSTVNAALNAVQVLQNATVTATQPDPGLGPG